MPREVDVDSWVAGQDSSPTNRLASLTGGSVRVARVPIDFARHPHDDAEQNEERDCSHEQRVVLLAQSNVKERVNAEEPATDHEGARAAPEEVAAIPGDQTGRGQRRDRVGGGEPD